MMNESQGGGGSGGSGNQASGGSGSSSSGSAPTDSPIYDDPITVPEQSLADRVAANLAQFGPLVSPLSGGFTEGTETVIIPKRPTSINWKPWLILGAIAGGIWYWYERRKKKG